MKPSELLKVGDLVRSEDKSKEFSIRCRIADIKENGLILLPEGDEDTEDLEDHKRKLLALWSNKGTLPVHLYFMLHSRRHVSDGQIRNCMAGENELMAGIEVPDAEIERMKSLVKEEMEDVITLSIPLKVDIGVGKNWAEAHA